MSHSLEMHWTTIKDVTARLATHDLMYILNYYFRFWCFFGTCILYQQAVIKINFLFFFLANCLKSLLFSFESQSLSSLVRHMFQRSKSGILSPLHRIPPGCPQKKWRAEPFEGTPESLARLERFVGSLAVPGLLKAALPCPVAAADPIWQRNGPWGWSSTGEVPAIPQVRPVAAILRQRIFQGYTSASSAM